MTNEQAIILIGAVVQSKLDSVDCTNEVTRNLAYDTMEAWSIVKNLADAGWEKEKA